MAHCRPARTLRVLDPACGDGELLFALHEVATRELPGVRLELTGHDLDTTALAVAGDRSRTLGVPVRWRAGDFLAARQAGGFDVIITNPPYVRTQQLGQQTARLLSERFGLHGRIDLTHPFLSLAPELLRPGGVLGVLSSNRFLSTKAGANVRRVLGTALRPVEVYDLGDTRLFEAAVLPAITVAVRGGAPPRCRFVSAYRTTATGPASADLFAALTSDTDSLVRLDNHRIGVRVGTLAPMESTVDPWRLSHAAGDDWLATVAKSTWKTFGEVAKIRVGIKTTADSVFISSDWRRLARPPEEELLLPLLTHHDLTPWRSTASPAARVLYPYDLSQRRRVLRDMTGFPAAMAYLEANGERLRRRGYLTDAGREWFELWVPQRPGLWRLPKIVFPDISEHARFAYDNSGAVVNGDCYWISLADIGAEHLAHLMLAVANSALGQRFYDEVCGNRLYSGRRRWITQYVSRFPLPDPATPAATAIVRQVRRILAGTGKPAARQLATLDRLVREAFAVAD